MTTRSTVPPTNRWRPFAIGPSSSPSNSATRGGTPNCEAAASQLLDQGFHIDLRQHGGGDPVGDRLLHIRITGQRPDRGNVAVGVPHDAVRPHRDDGQHRQQRGEEDQQDRAERAEAVM
ncbi:hypothetical protein [Streptomyces sp. NPDC007007]|uniref:hypothetical protein n=1 Tax=Streptomyces sp. NPDC007007 TaxID=3364770 RepID=UPI00368A0B1A